MEDEMDRLCNIRGSGDGMYTILLTTREIEGRLGRIKCRGIPSGWNTGGAGLFLLLHDRAQLLF